MAAITLQNLGFAYPGATSATLSSLDLSIANGEAHALLGSSGAGKTTLLHLLAGLLRPTAGCLLFDDEDVSGLSGRQRNVAQVFQFPVLYESLSVADNLSFPLKTRKATTRLIAERLDYICAELDIGALRHRKPASLSLFEKQLVAVGKALINPDASMVLLDEPLTAVEPRTKWRLRQTLRRVQEDLGITMIYVTHDQTEALTFADRVSVLADGGILQTGTPEQVYSEPEHEFVGHFVGSPGMNFLPAKTLGISGAERVGFRPEWVSLASNDSAAISSTPHLSTQLLRMRIEGTERGVPSGLLTLATAAGEIALRGRLPESPLKAGDPVEVSVDRYIPYSQQRRVRNHERV